VSARDRLLVAIVASAVAVVAAWMLVVQPKRDQASKLGDQISAAQSQLSSANATVSAARLAQTTFASNYTTVARLGEAVPSDDNMPSLIYQLQNAAAGARVDFRSLALASGGSTAAATPPPAAGTAGAAATQAVTATLPPGAAVGTAGLPTMPFTFVFRGNFFDLSDFFGRLQRFVTATDRTVSVHGRLMTVNAITLNPAPAGFPQIVATISATSYLVPQSQGLTGGATPAGPSSSQTVANTTTSSTQAPATVTAPVK
jgi:hypothetical protein